MTPRLRLISLIVRSFEFLGLGKWLQLFNFTAPGGEGKNQISVPLRAGVNLQLLRPPPAWADALYARLLPMNKGVFVDVGANLGQTLQLFLRNSSAGHRYIGIDPIPECCAYLRLLTKKNRMQDAVIVCSALGADSGFAELLCVAVAGSDADMSTLEPSLRDAKNYSERLLVAKARGDFILEQLHKDASAQFIKIDVEGFEYEVLKGFSETLRKHRPLVLCEVMFSNHSEEGRRMERRKQVAGANDLLRSLDYLFYHARHDGTIIPLPALPVKDWMAEDQNDYDFLFVPSERDAEFRQGCQDMIRI